MPRFIKGRSLLLPVSVVAAVFACGLAGMGSSNPVVHWVSVGAVALGLAAFTLAAVRSGSPED